MVLVLAKSGDIVDLLFPDSEPGRHISHQREFSFLLPLLINRNVREGLLIISFISILTRVASP